MIVEHRGLPRYVVPTGVFSSPYMLLVPLFLLSDLVLFLSVTAWLILSIALVMFFGAWFFLAQRGARQAMLKYAYPPDEGTLQRFALFFLFPMSSASASLATSHIQYLTVATAVALAFKGAWLFLVWCVVRFFVLGWMGGFLNPTFQASTREQASALLEALEEVQGRVNPS